MKSITESLNLESVKRYVILFSFAVFAAILADQIILSFLFKSAVTPSPKKFIKLVTRDKLPPLGPLSAYLDPIESRDLFNVGLKATANVARQTALLDLARNLRLIGIALFEKPEAIVQDAKTGGSVFVREGEKIGEITVKKIKPDSIVVSLAHESEEIKIKKSESGDA